MLWFYPYSFHYSMTPEEVGAAIGEALTLSPAGQYWVRPSTEGIRIGRKIGRWERGTFAPVFVGRYERSSRGTVLKGYFRPPLLSLAWMAFLAAVYVYQSYAQGAAVPTPHRYEFLWILIGLNLVGWWYELPSLTDILRGLKGCSARAPRP